MNVTRVLSGMQEKEAHFCVVILDCCRDFKGMQRTMRSDSRGLTAMPDLAGSVI